MANVTVLDSPTSDSKGSYLIARKKMQDQFIFAAQEVGMIALNNIKHTSIISLMTNLS